MNTIPTNTLDKARFLKGLEDQLKDTNLIGHSLKDTRCSFLASKIFKLRLPYSDEVQYLVEKILEVAQVISNEEYPNTFATSECKLWFMVVSNFDFFVTKSHFGPLRSKPSWKDDIKLNNPYFVYDEVPADPHGLDNYPTYYITREQFVQFIEAMVDFVNNGK